MNIKSCEKKEKNEADFIVEVNPEEFEAALGKAFIKNRNRISVPGFRKGKAPRKIIENMYGSSVFHEDALDILLPDAFRLVTEESELRIVGFPQATDIDVKDDKQGLDITITAAVYPEVTVGEYKGLSAVKLPVEVTDGEVDAEIEGMRLRNASIDVVDRPAADGDIAVIDYEGFIDGVPFEGGKGSGYDLELGSGKFIPGFEDKVVGMSAGEHRDLDLAFPDNYSKELAGKQAVFKVSLIEVKEKILPEPDDEFAKDVSEFDTLEEYRSDIREKFLKSRQEEADVAFENALMEILAGSVEADIPEAMIEEQMEVAVNNFAAQISSRGMDPSTYLQVMGVTPEAFRENMRTTGEKQVRVTLALEKIAELEGIEISDEDVDDEYKEGAERYKMEIDKLKESVDKKTILRDLKIRRAAQIVTENAVALDQPEETASPEDDLPDGEAPAKKSAAAKPAAKPKKPAAKKAAAAAEESAAEESAAEIKPETVEKPAKAPARKPKADKESKELN